MAVDVLGMSLIPILITSFVMLWGSSFSGMCLCALAPSAWALAQATHLHVPWYNFFFAIVGPDPYSFKTTANDYFFFSNCAKLSSIPGILVSARPGVMPGRILQTEPSSIVSPPSTTVRFFHLDLSPPSALPTALLCPCLVSSFVSCGGYTLGCLHCFQTDSELLPVLALQRLSCPFQMPSFSVNRCQTLYKSTAKPCFRFQCSTLNVFIH